MKSKAYLESILANLSAGVLVFDGDTAFAQRQPQRVGDTGLDDLRCCSV